MHRLIHRFALIAAMAFAAALDPAPAAAATSDDIKRIIVAESRETLVPSSLALAVAQVESGLRPDRQGRDGARGIYQLLPDTAEDLGLRPRELWDPHKNVRAGLRVLDNLLDRTEGRWDAALRAYASLRPARARAGAERYVSDVMGWERRFAERLALQDAVDGRRREVLMGHDDWRASQLPRQDMVARDTLADDAPEAEEPEIAARPSYLEPGEVDPADDDDTDLPVEVRIYRGGQGTEVEITLYQGLDEDHDDDEHEAYNAGDDDDDEVRWHQPPPPVVRHRPLPPRLWKAPRPYSKPFGWRSSRMQRGPRWSPRKAARLKRQARRGFGWRHR